MLHGGASGPGGLAPLGVELAERGLDAGQVGCGIRGGKAATGFGRGAQVLQVAEPGAAGGTVHQGQLAGAFTREFAVQVEGKGGQVVAGPASAGHRLGERAGERWLGRDRQV